MTQSSVLDWLINVGSWIWTFTDYSSVSVFPFTLMLFQESNSILFSLVSLLKLQYNLAL